MSGRRPEDLGPQVIAALRAQIDQSVRRGEIRPIAPEQFVVNLLSLCVFPFAARPMIAAMLGMDEQAFARFIADRRQDLAGFFIGALRP
jgi:hypothetical protein